MEFQNGLLTTLYLTFSHNQVAIAYFMGIIICIVMAIIKPSRTNIALVIAFILLLLGFEYDKHISDPLLDQTTASLATDGRIGKVDKAITYLISIIIPIFLYVTGWGLVFLSLITLSLKKDKSKQQVNS